MIMNNGFTILEANPDSCNMHSFLARALRAFEVSAWRTVIVVTSIAINVYDASTAQPGGEPPKSEAQVGLNAELTGNRPKRGSNQSPLGVIEAQSRAEARNARSPIPAKILRYAQQVIRRHDADGNGLLTRSEWGKLYGTPRLADIDDNGAISALEFAQRVVAYSRGRSLRLMPPEAQERFDSARSATVAAAETATRSSPRESPAGDDRKPGLPVRSKRFVISTSHLPAALPPWFATLDADGDGQVSMAEFSSKWSLDEAARFAKLDANADGVITAKEYVANGSKDARSDDTDGTSKGHEIDEADLDPASREATKESQAREPR